MQEPVRNRHDPASMTTTGNEHDEPITENRTENASTSSVANLPAESVSTKQPTTETGRGRVRQKWSKEMNTYIYRTYLLLTNLETKKTKFSFELHKRVIQKFPELANKTKQNVIDQRNQIEKKGWLSPVEIQQLRREVELELNLTTPADENEKDNPTNDITAENTVRTIQYEEPEIQLTDIPSQDAIANCNNSNSQLLTTSIYEKYQLLYLGTEPTKRPRLYKLKICSETKEVLKEVNNLLQQKSEQCTSIQELHNHIYIAALTVLELNGQKIENTTTAQTTTKWNMPPWERRLNNKIRELRRDIGKLTKFIQGKIVKPKVTKEIEIIKQKYKSEENVEYEDILDTMKMKLSVTASRLKRYKESMLRKKQNKLFADNQKLFYRHIEQPSISEASNDKFPSVEETKTLWYNIWGEPVQHNKKADWIQEERATYETLEMMPDQKITLEEVQEAIKRTNNWKTPGIDNIPNYWYKVFDVTHSKLAEFFNQLIQDPEQMPGFMTTGTTYLVPKTCPCSADASKYRPITCLPAIYKLFTSLISNKIYKHLELNNILTE